MNEMPQDGRAPSVDDLLNVMAGAFAHQAVKIRVLEAILIKANAISQENLNRTMQEAIRRGVQHRQEKILKTLRLSLAGQTASPSEVERMMLEMLYGEEPSTPDDGSDAPP